MAYESYTVQQFFDARYKDDRSIMSEEVYKTVEEEFVDTAGLYNTDEFDKVSYIHFLHNRVNTIGISLNSQRDFVKEFGIAYIPNFELLQEFGYFLIWENEKQFLDQLQSIEYCEMVFVDELQNSIKELNDLKEQSKKTRKVYSKKQSRESLVRTIVSLRKLGHQIKNTETTVEELAICIKDQKESAENL